MMTKRHRNRKFVAHKLPALSGKHTYSDAASESVTSVNTDARISFGGISKVVQASLEFAIVDSALTVTGMAYVHSSAAQLYACGELLRKNARQFIAFLMLFGVLLR